jgi:hypothetical protein
VSRIMIFAIIVRKKRLVVGDSEMRLAGSSKPKIGRANLLVSRIMIFAIIVRKKRLVA